MDASSFNCPEAGRVIRTSEGYNAFLPAPPSPKLAYDAPLVLALSRADSALSELAGLGRLLPNPRLLIAPYLRREAVLSSRIEGTRASLSDILMDEAQADIPHGDDADVREVRNYVTALEYGIKRLGSLPPSLRLVRELHAKLMKGVRGNAATAGEFRRSQNWIGPSGSTPVTANYVPPPPAEMQKALARWELFLHEREKYPDLVQCALMHEHFEAIHPFMDGNGRVGRLLITLFLVERERLTQPLLYLSVYIEAHRDEYYRLLQRVRTHCDWSAWLRFFLTGIAETAGDSMKRAAALIDMREKYRWRLRNRANAQALLDALFINPYITVAKAQKVLSVSNPTARQAVGVLQKEGLLKEVSGRKWGQLYVARPVLAAIEKPLS
ncbi:MAG TPA: Fic family protein [Burkholderiales bacterium]